MPVAVTTNGKRQRKADPIAFRLDVDNNDKLEKRLKEKSIIGINSVDKLARKLVIDALSGKLVYLNPADKFANPALS